MTPYRLLLEGVYECQADGCEQPATHTWPRSASSDQLGSLSETHRERLGEAHMAILSCASHAVPVHAQARLHVQDCPAPDPGCACSWDY